jgi:hypothetical protein
MQRVVPTAAGIVHPPEGYWVAFTTTDLTSGYPLATFGCQRCHALTLLPIFHDEWHDQIDSESE